MTQQTLELMELSLAFVEDLRRIWGSAAAGLALTHAHISGKCITIETLATKAGCGEETARRWVKTLDAIGRIQVEQAGRKRLYCADKVWAQWTVDRFQDLRVKVSTSTPQNGGKLLL